MTRQDEYKRRSKPRNRWEYVNRNFHKFDEDLKIKIALSVVTKGVIPYFSFKHRDISSPEAISWRKEVYERDKYTCVDCGDQGRLQAHHIKSWRNYPESRYDVSNGKTLCCECHKKTDNFGSKSITCKQENYAVC